MKTLGVVLAGGRSSRFGSDKSEAVLMGHTLLDHALHALRAQCDAVAVVGRSTDLASVIPDWPAPHHGPLGGLAGALRFAASDYDQVLSIPVDAVRLPANLREMLDPGPSCIATQPVIGLWPVTALREIEHILLWHGKHSMKALAAATGARMIDGIATLANVNTREDLAVLDREFRLAPRDSRSRRAE